MKRLLKASEIMDRTNTVEVGEFTLHPCIDYPDGSKSVWLEEASGEGGQFPALSLEKLLREFYDENF